MAQPHYLLDAHEAAQILRMDKRTLVRWARLGQVPAHPMERASESSGAL